MRVTNWRNECGSGNRQRVSVDVEYEDGSREDYWFELPADIPASRTGSPWLALLLPLAVASGEDLRVEWPVDPYLLQNAETLIALWACWFPNLATPIRIFAEPLPAGVPLPGASASFTAGVDSFFTVLRHPESKFYVNVLGLDMPRWKKDAYERLTSRLERIAQELGARLVRVATNVRETRWGKIPWEKIGCAGAITAAHLQLEQVCGTALIPASFRIQVLHPFGLHPLTVPMFSTSTTRILFDGASHSRHEKIEAIADYRVVQQNLQVCFVGQDRHGQDDTNCSRCEKCLRTMIVLDILGKLPEFPTFDLSSYRVELAARMDCIHPARRSVQTETKDLAVRRGRLDIARHLDLSLRRSKRAALLQHFERWPILWRLPYYYEKHAFGALAHLDWIGTPPSAGAPSVHA